MRHTRIGIALPRHARLFHDIYLPYSISSSSISKYSLLLFILALVRRNTFKLIILSY